MHVFSNYMLPVSLNLFDRSANYSVIVHTGTWPIAVRSNSCCLFLYLRSICFNPYANAKTINIPPPTPDVHLAHTAMEITAILVINQC